MLALTTQEGDVVVRSDENKSYVRNSGTAGTMNDFTLLATPTDAVLSINGNTGAISAAQIASAVEAASDSNTFTDADHSKLNAIEASATADQTSTEIKSLLASDNITGSHIADDALNSEHYVDGSIDRAHLSNDIIDGTKIADNAIGAEHIAGNAVGSSEIATNAVGQAELAGDAVTGTHIADDAINSEHYVDGSIDHQHLSANCVDGDNIADDSINSEHYVDAVSYTHLTLPTSDLV